MPLFLGLTVTTYRGDLLPAVGQKLVAAGPPKVVDTSKAVPVESPFETEVECATLADALALAATHRSMIGFLTVFNGGLVFVGDCHPVPYGERGAATAILRTKWSLFAAPSWVPDAD